VLPHLVFDDFLGQGLVESLLNFVMTKREDFAPARIRDAAPDFDHKSARNCLRLRDFEPLRRDVVDAVDAVVDHAAATLGLQGLSPADKETEMVCTGDGGFYKTHDDTFSPDRKRFGVRALTFVYYFHRRPKGFEGGDLRLYSPMPGRSEEFVDVAPASNRLVAFPAFFPHEARPVRCTSGRFEDSRFSINCWIYRAVGERPAP